MFPSPLPMFMPVFRQVGTTIEYKRFPSDYKWRLFLDLGTMIMDSSGYRLHEQSFDYLSPNPLALVVVPIDGTVTWVSVEIDIPFDVPAFLSIGDVVYQGGLMTIEDCNPQEVSAYETVPNLEYNAPTALFMYLSAFGATQGAGHIAIEYET